MKRMKPKWRENLMRREKTPLHIDNVAGNIVRSTGGEKDGLILNVSQNLTKKDPETTHETSSGHGSGGHLEHPR